jgi:hypothetical protein
MAAADALHSDSRLRILYLPDVAQRPQLFGARPRNTLQGIKAYKYECQSANHGFSPWATFDPEWRFCW